MTITINEIASKSGDSVLLDYVFSDGLLILKLKMDEIDADLILSIQTHKLDCVQITKLSDMEKYCHVELIRINDELKIENGFYVPEMIFAKFMKSCKKGLSLAFGMKSTDQTYLFSIIGSTRLLSCVIENLDSDIKFELS